MQLTQFTDYALRSLIYIAVKGGGCTISEIASAYTLSENHLVKIIHRLSKEGIVNTTRGKKGGVNLACNPSELNLKDIVCLLESNFHLVPCFNAEKANCRIIPVCKLKRVLEEAKQQFLSVLAEYSLADLITNSSALSDALGIQNTEV